MTSLEINDTIAFINARFGLDSEGFWFDLYAPVQIGLGLRPYAYGEVEELLSCIRNRLVVTAREEIEGGVIIRGIIHTEDAGDLTFSYEEICQN